jgi:polyisoprenoid-binding protein YceI
MDGARHAGFSAKAKVNRKDWNLDWNVALEAGGWLVGETVKLEIEVAVQELAPVVLGVAA